MGAEPLAGGVALVWLIGALVAMARSVRRGQRLADTLATRHPEAYEALGRPRPGFFQGVRQSRFAHFVGHREYEALPEPGLVERFEAFRRAEARLLLWLLASLAPVALLVFLVQRGV